MADVGMADVQSNANERKLPSTLQTWLGMVKDNGMPKIRFRPFSSAEIRERYSKLEITGTAPVWSSETALYEFFTTCLLQGSYPKFTRPHDGAAVARLRFNVDACRNSQLSIDFMKQTCSFLARLDLEQVAALVLSAISHDESIPDKAAVLSALIKNIEPHVLVNSCMWLDSSDMNLQPTDEMRKFRRTASLARRITSKKDVEIGLPSHWSALLDALLRVRRSRPKDHSRCLFIPEWIFDAASAPVTPEYKTWDYQGMVRAGDEPICPAREDSIILPRKAFRALQRRILYHYRFYKPVIRLRKEIRDLENDVLFSANHFRRQILPSTDTLAIASHFVAVQRRLQRKVVSDMNWAAFLKKGESARLIQNTPHNPTAFETCLERFYLQRKASSRILPITDALLPQIDQCCLLMESYVLTHAPRGRKEELVFRMGQRGGSGRGPVDDYNLLADILSRLKATAMNQGVEEVPGKVRKFLAKDIMHYNNSFADDAFASDVPPGWETWLAKRRVDGLLLSEWEHRGGFNW